jgi:hypothetical protein
MEGTSPARAKAGVVVQLLAARETPMTPQSSYGFSVCVILTAIAGASFGVGCTVPPELAPKPESGRSATPAGAT